MKDVVWLSLNEATPARGYWDQYLLELAFAHHIHALSITDQKEAVVIIPGAYQSGYINAINKEIARLTRCAVIVTSDEENKFPVGELKHPNMKVYATYPTFEMKGVAWLPIGAPPHSRDIIPSLIKPYHFSFAGQINHPDRVYMKNVISSIKGLKSKFVETAGFAQGLPHSEYYKLMSQSKVVLCPRGNVSPDSFRLYEALESYCIPIVENTMFWTRMFGIVPFPIVDSKREWERALLKAVYRYDVLPIFRWWEEKKKRIIDELRSL